jgi:hypothetical protein
MNNKTNVRVRRASKVLGLPKEQLNLRLVDIVFSSGNQKVVYEQLFRCDMIVQEARKHGLSPLDVLQLIRSVK